MLDDGQRTNREINQWKMLPLEIKLITGAVQTTASAPCANDIPIRINGTLESKEKTKQ